MDVKLTLAQYQKKEYLAYSHQRQVWLALKPRTNKKSMCFFDAKQMYAYTLYLRCPNLPKVKTKNPYSYRQQTWFVLKPLTVKK